jgi:hypothetical protein
LEAGIKSSAAKHEDAVKSETALPNTDHKVLIPTKSAEQKDRHSETANGTLVDAPSVDSPQREENAPPVEAPILIQLGITHPGPTKETETERENEPLKEEPRHAEKNMTELPCADQPAALGLLSKAETLGKPEPDKIDVPLLASSPSSEIIQKSKNAEIPASTSNSEAKPPQQVEYLPLATSERDPEAPKKSISSTESASMTEASTTSQISDNANHAATHAALASAHERISTLHESNQLLHQSMFLSIQFPILGGKFISQQLTNLFQNSTLCKKLFSLLQKPFPSVPSRPAPKPKHLLYPQRQTKSQTRSQRNWFPQSTTNSCSPNLEQPSRMQP